MRKIAHMQTHLDRGVLGLYIHNLSTDKGLLPADIERRAQGRTSYSRIAGLAAGDFDNVRWETLRALAKGLGVAEERLFAVAIGITSEDYRESDFINLNDKYLDLAGDDRAAADSLLQLLHREISRLQGRQNGSCQASFDAATKNGKELSEKRESLRDYVARVLKEKRLKLQDVTERSQQQISKGYLCYLLHNRAANPTIAKIKALASGLGVEPQEIFVVLEAHALTAMRRFQGSVFAKLYDEYQQLTPENKRELRLLLKLIDHEIDKRQLQQLRQSNR